MYTSGIILCYAVEIEMKEGICWKMYVWQMSWL